MMQFSVIGEHLSKDRTRSFLSLEFSLLTN